MKINREIKPSANGEISFTLPELDNFELSSGLNVTFIKKDNLPIIHLNLLLNAGSKFDPENKKGLAYLTSLVIDEGAAGLSSLEIDDEFETLGTIFRASTDSDLIYFSMLSLTDNFRKSVDLLAKIITKPDFNHSDFERERNKLLTKITQLRDDAGSIASLLFENLIYAPSFYAHPVIGKYDDVNSISRDELLNFYSNYFCPSDSHLIVVGSISKRDLLNELESNFSCWKNIGKTKASQLQIAETSKKHLFICNKEDAPQSELRIGHLTNSRSHPDYFGKSILNTILGGQFSSRLNHNLREEKGFTYGVNSSFDYNKESGSFGIATAVKTENTVDALNEILIEMNRIKNDVTDEEVDFAKSYLIKRFPSLFQTNNQLSNNVMVLVSHNLPSDYFDRYLEMIEQCDTKTVLEMADKYLYPENIVTVIVGNKNEILKSLDRIEWEQVTELDFEGNVIGSL